VWNASNKPGSAHEDDLFSVVAPSDSTGSVTRRFPLLPTDPDTL